MRRRSAVTLMEVLIAMFIMAIGMLALLALFPVGAVSMAQALKDDRCASTAAMAENLAITLPTTAPGVVGIRHDPNVVAGFALSTTIPNKVVYVDPYGVQAFEGSVGGVIPRVTPSYVGANSALADRWFSLPDDMTFLENGTPQTDGTFLDRGRRYSYAYLLRAPQPNLTPLNPDLVQLTVVVYSGRPVKSLALAQTFEWPYTVAAVIPPNGVQIAAVGTTAKRGGWIMDTNGNFYRITNIAEIAGTTTLETQQNRNVVAGQNILIMDYVAEVFDKGTSWQP